MPGRKPYRSKYMSETSGFRAAKVGLIGFGGHEHVGERGHGRRG